MRGATQEIGRVGWAATLLSQPRADGHWTTPGSSAVELYFPKFVATHWISNVLADLGLTRTDSRIRRVAALLFDRWSARGGHLSGTVREACVTGMAVRMLVRFGYLDHPAVQRSIAGLLRAQKESGGWTCPASASPSGTLDCWEPLAALGEIPERRRDEKVQRAIQRGAEFFLGLRLMDEGTTRYPPWFRIHYPNHYYYDVLVGLRILTRLGYGGDPRLGPALRWLRNKRRPDGTWALDAIIPDLDPRLTDYRYGFDDLGEILFPMMLEPLDEPSRWATVEALGVLARVARS